MAKQSQPPRKMLRQTKWKVKMFQRGRCINCGEPRGDSPYKRKCRTCANEERQRHQKKYVMAPWKPGLRGRPPLDSKK